MPAFSNRATVAIPVIAACMLAAMWWVISATSRSNADTIVVYCAHDRVYAEQILEGFARQSGIKVHVRYDTEATKSLGLINLLLQERQQPRCDVFWNNELLGMVELQQQGALESHQGTGWNRIPEQYRDPDGQWVGFAARLRVFILNSAQVAADNETLTSLFSLEPTRVAIARPLFGTTLTHYTVMWKLWGPDQLKAWHRDLHLRGLREVDGNAAVKDVVARGICDAGMTDTDDVFVAIDDGLAVEMLPIRLSVGETSGGVSIAGIPMSVTNGVKAPAESQHPDQSPSAAAEFKGENAVAVQRMDDASVPRSVTICIPNTVGIIKGTKHVEAARKLVDFLASEETELALARSKSRQIPLGPVDETRLSEEVKKLTSWSRDGIDLRSLLPARRECLAWLKDEYVK
jgi:iron(III) transport system substrate-binding protein